MSFHASESGAGTIAGRLRVVQALRADDLADDLAALFSGPAAPDVLQESFVVVQGPGMSNWVRAAMIERLGAWGGVECPFLRDFLLGLSARAGLGPAVPRGRHPVRELAYRIAAAALQVQGARPGPTSHAIEPFLAMCRGDDGTLDLANLLAHARALAEAFDGYEMDRPDLIEAWRALRAWRPQHGRWGDLETSIEGWQRALWSMCAREWAPHEAWQGVWKLGQRLERGDRPESLRGVGFVSVFGVSSVPPRALELLVRLARHVPVHVHMLVPTMAFMDRHELRRAVAARAAARRDEQAVDTAAEGVDPRHPMIASLAAAAADAAEVLDRFGIEPERIGEGDPSREASSRSQLQALQHALAHDLSPASQSAPRDGSVQVHGVSTPTRAAEVAHDEILRAFAELSVSGTPLRQEQVVILSPAVETFAGPLQSVFVERRALHGRHESLSLRFADGAARDRSPVAVTLRKAMQFALEDQPFSELCGLLQSGPVLARLGTDADEISRLLQKLEQAGARRFLDAAARASWLGAARPDDPLHTVRWAVDRLTLGMVAGGSPAADTPLQLTLPSGELGAQAFDTMHGMLRIVDALDALAVAARGGARTMRQWHELLTRLAGALLPRIDHKVFGRDLQQAMRALCDVLAASETAALPALPWHQACREFVEQLDALTEGASFASGGIALARLAPMRSVPHRVVVLLGLDHGVFPRPNARSLLDLRSLRPRLGDRDERAEDQLLLLETLHAASDRVVLVVTDRVASTAQPAPLSPVVQELVEVIASHERIDAGQARRDVVVPSTSLADQPEAWRADAVAGFDRVARERAERLQGARLRPAERAFLTGTAEAGVAPVPPASVEQIVSTLRNPAREFLRAHGLRVPDGETVQVERSEPTELGPLSMWSVRMNARVRLLAGQSERGVLRRALLTGELPHGATGEMAWHEVWQLESPALELLEQALGAPSKVQQERFTVPGMQPELRACTLRVFGSAVQVLVGRTGKPQDWLGLWIEHLAFSAAFPGVRSLHLELANRRSDRARWFWRDPIGADEARETLEALRAIAGEAARTPLPFHVKLLHKWRTAKAPDVARRLQAVRKEFERSSDAGPSIASDPAIRHLYRGLDFFAEGTGTGGARCGPVQASFVSLADFLGERMDATGWPATTRGKGSGA